MHNKLDAVKFYNQYTSKLYKTSNYKTISIGDSENDIEMLNYSDYSGIVKREDGKKIKLNKNHSNKLMRIRVLFQAVAIFIFVIIIWLARN